MARKIMTVDVTEAQGTVLDILVAQCEGIAITGRVMMRDNAGNPARVLIKSKDAIYNPTDDLTIASLIIFREGIHTVRDGRRWRARITDPSGVVLAEAFGDLPQVAALRCRCLHKLGPKADIPALLLKDLDGAE